MANELVRRNAEERSRRRGLSVEEALEIGAARACAHDDYVESKLRAKGLL